MVDLAMVSSTILLRHELAILDAVARRSIRDARDLLTLLLGVPLLLVLARSWIGDLPAGSAMAVSAAAGWLVAYIGIPFGLDRLTYHQTVGVVTAYAHGIPQQGIYLAALLAAWLVLGAVAAALLLPVEWRAWAAGALGGITSALTLRWLLGWGPVDRARGWVRSRWATTIGALRWGAAAGSVGSLAIVGAWLIDAAGMAAISSIVVLALGLLLVRVRPETVRFMALVGNGSPATLWRYAAPFLAFSLPVTLVGMMTLAPPLALLLGAVLLALLCLSILRVLASRVFPARMVELVVTGVGAAIVAIGFAMPPAIPLLLAAALVWLARRARGATWLLP